MKLLVIGLSASFVGTLLSIIVTASMPLDLEVESRESPYASKIDKLIVEHKNGMDPSAQAELEELTQKNNQWFEDQVADAMNARSEQEVWVARGIASLPAMGLIWCIVMIVFLIGSRPSVRPAMTESTLLAFPVLLLLVGMFSIMQVAVIVGCLFTIRVAYSVFRGRFQTVT